MQTARAYSPRMTTRSSSAVKAETGMSRWIDVKSQRAVAALATTTTTTTTAKKDQSPSLPTKGISPEEGRTTYYGIHFDLRVFAKVFQSTIYPRARAPVAGKHGKSHLSSPSALPNRSRLGVFTRPEVAGGKAHPYSPPCGLDISLPLSFCVHFMYL